MLNDTSFRRLNTGLAQSVRKRYLKICKIYTIIVVIESPQNGIKFKLYGTNLKMKAVSDVRPSVYRQECS